MTDLLHSEVHAPSPERAREIAALGPWFHNLHLPDGAQTAPTHALGDFPSDVWAALENLIPWDLDGWHALDIGCNSGFYSIELAKRGARVVAMDMEPLFLTQAGWAAREFGLADRIDVREGSVYDLAGWRERFDLVLFMGVLYHLRYPLLALDAVAQCTDRLMVFQTLTMPGLEVRDDTHRPRSIGEREDFVSPGWPKMAFIEHAFAGDATNWWAPNHAGVEAMLRSTGMRVAARPGVELYVCEPDRERATWATPRGAGEFRAASGRPGAGTTRVDAGPPPTA